jgi:hypothetical protein
MRAQRRAIVADSFDDLVRFRSVKGVGRLFSGALQAGRADFHALA